MNIRTKLVALGLGGVLVTALALTLVGIWQSSALSRQAQNEVDGMVTSDLNHVLGGVTSLLQVQSETEGSAAALARVRKQVAGIQIGQSGYVFILRGKGSNRGEYLVSKDDKRDGENIWNASDSSGHHFIQEIVNKAIALQPGQYADERYLWKNPGETKPRWKIARIAYIARGDWVIGATAYEDDVRAGEMRIHQAAMRMIVLFALLGIVLSAVGAGLALYASKQMAVPLVRAVDALHELQEVDLPSLDRALQSWAAGDLTASASLKAQPLPVTTKDEIGTLSQTFNAMLDRFQTMTQSFEAAKSHLSRMIGQVTKSSAAVQETASMLTSAARETNEAASQSSEAIQQVATAIQQVAKGATIQTEQITHAATSMQQLTASTNEIAKGAQDQARAIQASLQTLEDTNLAVQTMAAEAKDAAQAAAQADQTAKEGNDVVQKTVEGMLRIQRAVEASSNKIQELGKSSEQIGAIIAVIEEIAEQTNLLALNAAIEAARAGEQGRGFAVVADEVRKLAERSAGATKEISALIAAVQKGTQEVVEAMSQGSAEVERGSELAQQAGGALESIQSTVQQSRKQFQSIEAALVQAQANAQTVLEQIASVASVTEESAAAAKEMETGAEQVEKAMEGIAAISEENSAATEEVSASTEEVSAATEEMQAQVEEMAHSARRLSELANDLSQMVAQFKIEEGDGEEEAVKLRMAA